jgi:sugar O-acyltransferase (sialic acid O-acetyltransferase NeuD family)
MVGIRYAHPTSPEFFRSTGQIGASKDHDESGVMKVQRIAIIGAGGMAREVASTLARINQSERRFELVGYVVSELSSLGERDSRDLVVGDFQWLERHRSSVDALALGVGYPSVRFCLAEELSARIRGFPWPAIVDPTAVIDMASADLGEGCFVGAGVVATVNLVLEPFALCNFGCTLGHEVRIGRCSVVNPGANISGGVTIGESALIGTGAQVLQYLRVGSGAIVGAGAVVTRHVLAGSTVLGIPARAQNADGMESAGLTEAPRASKNS